MFDGVFGAQIIWIITETDHAGNRLDMKGFRLYDDVWTFYMEYIWIKQMFIYHFQFGFKHHIDQIIDAVSLNRNYIILKPPSPSSLSFTRKTFVHFL